MRGAYLSKVQLLFDPGESIYSFYQTVSLLPNMKRRTVLAATAAGIAHPLTGCVATDSDVTGNTTNDESTDTKSTENTPDNTRIERDLEPCDLPHAEDVEMEPAGDSFPELSVEGDKIPDDHESGLAAFIQLTRQYTANTPAQLQIDLMNRSEQPREVTFGASPPFSRYRSDHEQRNAIYIVPAERTHVYIEHVNNKYEANADPEEPIDDCWQIEDIERNDLAHSKTLEPCETLTETYSIFASADNDDCLPAGGYRFESSWVNSPGAEVEFSVDWGFTLTVEESDD